MAAQLLLALDYMHKDKLFVHRDVKPENVFVQYKTRDDDGNEYLRIVLGDFDVAKHYEQPGALVYSRYGTSRYAAPELSENERSTFDGTKADVWSLGCTLHAMARPDLTQTFITQENTREGRFESVGSANLTTLLKDLLKYRPQERATCEELLRNPILKPYARYLIQQTDVGSALSARQAKPGFLGE